MKENEEEEEKEDEDEDEEGVKGTAKEIEKYY